MPRPPRAAVRTPAALSATDIRRDARGAVQARRDRGGLHGACTPQFHELWANHSSQIAGEALKLFGVLYDVEREAQALDADQRRAIRQQQSPPATMPYTLG
jgi:hypothetical protein